MLCSEGVVCVHATGAAGAAALKHQNRTINGHPDLDNTLLRVSHADNLIDKGGVLRIRIVVVKNKQNHTRLR